jgi:hypothetical protein
MEMVNYRLEHLIRLPKDALPEHDDTPRAPQEPSLMRREARGQSVTDARLETIAAYKESSVTK